jgi:hypothetical protein
MPYVNRDKGGKIVGVFEVKQRDGQELIANSKDAEVVAFRAGDVNEDKIRASIQAQMRLTAIKELKTANKIPADYPEPTVLSAI